MCKAQKDLPNFVQGNEQFDYFVIDFFFKDMYIWEDKRAFRFKYYSLGLNAEYIFDT